MKKVPAKEMNLDFSTKSNYDKESCTPLFDDWKTLQNLLDNRTNEAINNLMFTAHKPLFTKEKLEENEIYPNEIKPKH